MFSNNFDKSSNIAIYYFKGNYEILIILKKTIWKVNTVWNKIAGSKVWRVRRISSSFDLVVVK